MITNTETELQLDTDVLEEKLVESKLVLHNDDYNTFDWVIETLIEVCNHDELQAEQCALIVHHKGKCSVSHGSYTKMKMMKDEIVNRGINATVEK
ncbi:MAG: ATP-dependent Clp protease adaptor ClpS [Bacteroidetes bacterium]|nr:ATP-dependent Clp protease adaptor ClpS [Bacteroidota bacterium]MBK8657319.1 ATP-dependent Clp protease adaptor ClpS [Bacteroidota bacterium]